MKYILVLFILISCKSNDCSNLPSTFESYPESLAVVESATFNFTNQLDTSESSWIRGAHYYSCDNITGFLIIDTDSNSYIHERVPLTVWEAFENAKSFGSFYNRNVKGRFQLQLD